jgi:hypothetical protein
MAIFGAGSNWDGNEMKDDFFADENFVIGWDYDSAKDLYDAVSLLKAGDIIYLNSSSPSSRNLRIKGIGVVTKSFIHCLIEKGLTKEEIVDGGSFFIKIKWVFKEEFHIVIPKSEGKLTHVRAGTFYEEYLPYVQKEIIDKLFVQTS